MCICPSYIVAKGGRAAVISSDMNDVLLLLGVAIFADKRVLASEVEVFTKSVSRLKLAELDFSIVSEAKALSWFELNRDLIQSKFKLPRADFETWFLPILSRIRQHSDIEALKYLLQLIFEADAEVHVSEIALMKLVEREWDITQGTNG
jgi:hypothetical protein